jgi:hypothetical protein
MKTSLPLLILSTAITTLLSCNQTSDPVIAEKTISSDSLISRGHYLVTVIGCGDCHSPKKFGPMGPVEDTSLLLSGYPASLPVAPVDTATAKNWVLFDGMQNATVGPWGVSFAANITSDATGIGSWTEEQFITALREGKSKGLQNNRMLLPPMPWQDYAHLHDEDLKAIFAYLKSTRPVKNVVPAPLAPNQLNKKPS